MDNQEMMGLLKEIGDGAEEAAWQRLTPLPDLASHDLTAQTYRGLLKEWTLSIIAFDGEHQGGPKGSRGYEAVGVRGGPHPVVLRLPPELAERLFRLAEKKAK